MCDTGGWLRGAGLLLQFNGLKVMASWTIVPTQHNIIHTIRIVFISCVKGFFFIGMSISHSQCVRCICPVWPSFWIVFHWDIWKPIPNIVFAFSTSLSAAAVMVLLSQLQWSDDDAKVAYSKSSSKKWRWNNSSGRRFKHFAKWCRCAIWY